MNRETNGSFMGFSSDPLGSLDLNEVFIGHEWDKWWAYGGLIGVSDRLGFYSGLWGYEWDKWWDFIN